MRKFKCFDCNRTWECPFGAGGRGVDQTCPECGSRNIHRYGEGWGFGRGRGRRKLNAETPSDPIDVDQGTK
jgi:hypothetical protein